MRRRLSLAIVAGLTAIALPTWSGAQPAPSVDPRADQILRQASDFLKQQPSYRFQADIAFDDVMPPDLKLMVHGTAQVMVRHPNEFRVDYTGDRRQASFYFDGQMFTLLDKQANTYASLPAAQTIGATLDQVQKQYDFSVPLADFVTPDLYKSLASQIKTGYYVGNSVVGGVSTSHLIFSQNNIDWQIWIENGKQPVPRMLVITYKNLPGSPQYTALLSQWAFKPLEASLFRFTPPPNAIAIEFIPIAPQSATRSSSPRK